METPSICGQFLRHCNFWLTFIPLSALKPMNVKSQRGVCRIYGDTSFNKALMAGYPQTNRLKKQRHCDCWCHHVPTKIPLHLQNKISASNMHLTKWFLALSPHHFWRSIPLIIPYLGNISWISTSKGPTKHRGTSTRIFVHNGPLWVQNDQPGSLGDTMCREELHDDFLRTKKPTNPGKRKSTGEVPIYMGQESTRIRAILCENTNFSMVMIVNQGIWRMETCLPCKKLGKARDWWWFMWFKCAEG